jgi:ABC-type Fe3+-siderophore transport system permease subunit
VGRSGWRAPQLFAESLGGPRSAGLGKRVAMDTPAPESTDPQLTKRRSIVVSLVGAALAVLVSVLIDMLWKARGWPHLIDASSAGFFFVMAIAQGVFMPSRRPRGRTLLFAFVTATAAWLLVHFLNAALLAPQ